MRKPAAAVLLSALAALSVSSAGLSRTAATDCFGLSATIVGTDGPDQLVGTPGNDVIVGEGGDDALIGFGGDDAICGGAGNDGLVGGSGNDRIDGGGGGAGPGFIDLVFFELSPGPVRADLRAGTATGEGSDTLVNVSGFSGTGFGDTLVGDDLVNQFYPGRGDDVIDGGGGDDLVGFDAAVVASLAAGSSSGEGADRLTSIEMVSGSVFRDVLTGDGRRNYLAGNGGDDDIDGGAGDDRVFGDDGTDTVLGGSGDDSLGGNAGDDTVSGGGGTFDLVSYRSATGIQANLPAGRITGQGLDRVTGIESINGSPGRDRMVGDAQVNFLLGNAGADSIGGGPGADFLNGGAGANSISDGPGRDYCLEGAGATRCEISGVPGPIPAVPDQPPASRTSTFARVSEPGVGIVMPLPSGHSARWLRLRTARLRALRVFAAEAAPRQTRFSETSLLWPLDLLLPSATPRGAGSFRYAGQPSCFAARKPYRTTVAPPDQLEPAIADGNLEHTWWRGVLFRQDRETRKLVRLKSTPWVTAIVQGPGVPTGIPLWTNAAQNTFISTFGFTVPAGSYTWVGKIKWERTDAQFTDFIEPHIVHAPKVQPDKGCTFGG